jgi:predicted RNase H-like nuclease
MIKTLETICVAGVDGTPGGWAVTIMDREQLDVRKVTALSDLFDERPDLEIVAIDVPIGLLERYEKGGRACDRAARKLLGKYRWSSVFPAPIRSTLMAKSWDDACALSRNSAPQGRAISKQTFAILPKIREVDDLLQTRTELRAVVREIHPEVSFAELAGSPMIHSKSSKTGQEERRIGLTRAFPKFAAVEDAGRRQKLPVEDILDATVACWSASRLATGIGRRLPETAFVDSAGLPMAIWV